MEKKCVMNDTSLYAGSSVVLTTKHSKSEELKNNLIEYNVKGYD